MVIIIRESLAKLDPAQEVGCKPNEDKQSSTLEKFSVLSVLCPQVRENQLSIKILNSNLAENQSMPPDKFHHLLSAINSCLQLFFTL